MLFEETKMAYIWEKMKDIYDDTLSDLNLNNNLPWNLGWFLLNGEINICCLYVKIGFSKQILKLPLVKCKHNKKGLRMLQHQYWKFLNWFYVVEVCFLLEWWTVLYFPLIPENFTHLKMLSYSLSFLSQVIYSKPFYGLPRSVAAPFSTSLLHQFYVLGPYYWFSAYWCFYRRQKAEEIKRHGTLPVKLPPFQQC